MDDESDSAVRITGDSSGGGGGGSDGGGGGGGSDGGGDGGIGGDGDSGPGRPGSLSDRLPVLTPAADDPAAVTSVESLSPPGDGAETTSAGGAMCSELRALAGRSEVLPGSPFEGVSKEEGQSSVAERLVETGCQMIQEGGGGSQLQSAMEDDTQECLVVEVRDDQRTVEGSGLESPTGSAPVTELDTSHTNDSPPAVQTSAPVEFDRMTSSDSGFVESSQDSENLGKNSRRRARLPFSLAELRRQVAELETTTSESDDRGQEWRFRAAIKPSDNSAAEEELNLQIQKEDFLKVRAVGLKARCPLNEKQTSQGQT